MKLVISTALLSLIALLSAVPPLPPPVLSADEAEATAGEEVEADSSRGIPSADSTAQTRPSMTATSSAAARRGKILYLKNCVACHRANGSGGRKTTAAGEPSPNFRDPRFWSGKKDADLIVAIEKGTPGSGMISFKGVLSAQEIKEVASYIRSSFRPKVSRPRIHRKTSLEEKSKTPQSADSTRAQRDSTPD